MAEVFELRNRSTRDYQALKLVTALHKSWVLSWLPRAQNVSSGYIWKSLREAILTFLCMKKCRVAISGTHSTGGASQASCRQGFGKLSADVSASTPGTSAHPSLHLPRDTQHPLPFHCWDEAAPVTGELWGEHMMVIAQAGTPGCGCGLDLSLGPRARWL